MSNKNIVIVGIVIIIIAVGAAIYWSATNQKNMGANPAPASYQKTANVKPPASVGQQSPSTIVMYTGTAFMPQAVTIKKGGTVAFVNASNVNFWPASNPHPFHTDYPTTGGCIGSTFDACKLLAPGQVWSFTFDYVGSWGYHDHINHNAGGTVVVQ